MTDAALRDVAARAATGDGAAREQLTGAARAQARDILAEDRFHATKGHEGPLHDVFAWLGDRLDDLVAGAPGGHAIGWLLLTAIAVGVAAVLAAWLGAHRRRAAGAPGRGRPLGLDAATAASPSELERRALAADGDGDLDTAVRLRFTAGLLRLDALHAIDLRPSLTSGDVGREIKSSRYDTLAATHDAIAYGGRHATDADADAAREEWPSVVREARR